MSGGEVVIRHVGEGRTDVTSEGAEERVRQRHAAIFVAQEPLAPVFGVGFASNVARLDHPVDEVGDGRG